MGSHIFDSEPSLEIARQIDACCQAFERAWKAGEAPKLEEFVTRVSAAGRAKLLRELLILELNYRCDGSSPLADSQVCALHPALATEIARQLKLLRNKRAPIDDVDTDVRLAPGTVKHISATIDLERPARDSRSSHGLHIRCPHCSNAVELLSDTPFESITCSTCGSAFSLVNQSNQTIELPTLKSIDRFELVARLGMGGFGTVWKARDTELDRTVAVKIPRKGQLARDEVEQFFREARSAAQLRHPNIVPVHEVGRDGETIFIVSDLIRGVSLSDWLSGATPTWREIAKLMATISDALHHAHQKGVIHRDLKPSNILLDDACQPHIMDFGLAKREIGEITMTVQGNILGTPAYMSPEQAAGEGHLSDRRSDIYSVGVILFRMLTGELPFRGNAQMQIHQRLNEDPPDPRKLNRQLPRDLCTICLKCLERDPHRRYATAKELADEFGRFLRGEPILSRPIGRIERALRWGRRKPALAAAVVLTIFLAIAGPLAAVVFQRQRALLQTRLEENNHLVDRYRNDVQRTAGQIKELRNDLDVWEGHANPWEIWLSPSKRDQPPRQDMVVDVLNHSGPLLVKRLSDGKYDNEKTARGYLGLAALADAAGNSSDAINYYQRASVELAKLRKQNPELIQFARAAAECHMRLARLTHDTDRDAAANHLDKARLIYKQLAAKDGNDAMYQIDWLESELASSMGASAESKTDHLQRVEAINHALADKWPTEPDAFYRLACYLTAKQPILLPSAAKMSSESAHESGSANSD